MITTALALITAHPHIHPVIAVLSQGGPPIPNPPPTPLPGNAAGGAEKIVGYIKWFAGLGLAGLFFAGLVAFSAGRVIDHRHYGRVGTMMMICSLGGALLYASGYSLISTFAKGQ
jgi:hypothetical protein